VTADPLPELRQIGTSAFGFKRILRAAKPEAVMAENPKSVHSSEKPEC